MCLIYIWLRYKDDSTHCMCTYWFAKIDDGRHIDKPRGILQRLTHNTSGDANHAVTKELIIGCAFLLVSHQAFCDGASSSRSRCDDTNERLHTAHGSSNLL